MSIQFKDGHSRSTRTPAEEEALLARDLEGLNDEEREAIELILAGVGHGGGSEGAALLAEIGKLEWKRTPVDMETFVMDPYYLGNTCDNLYPRLLEDLTSLFHEGYREAVLTGAIGWGKCLGADTEVFDVASGRRRFVAEEGELAVPAMTEAEQIEPHDAAAFPSGEKPCLRLVLASGVGITLSTDHPVYTSRGWVRAEEMQMGDLVATPRSIPGPRRPLEISDDEVALAALLAADGGTTATVTFTNAHPRMLREFLRLTEALGGRAAPTAFQNAGRATTLGTAGLLGFVRGWDLDCKATEKRVPATFWGLPDRQVALFVNRFWACDGSVYVRSPSKIETTLASRGLIEDLRFMLLRLGVHARTAPKTARYTTEGGEVREFPAWKLTVTGRDNMLRFLDAVGDIFTKEEGCRALRDAILPTQGNTNTDLVPVNAELLQEEGLKLPRKFRRPEGQLYSRATFKTLVEELSYRGPHAKHAHNDLRWERIKSIEDAGVQTVYDLSVPGPHSFVANGVVVHNTFGASIGVCRLLYELSCMRDPHRSFGIAANSNISIVCLSVNEVLATKVAYENIATKIEASPYFQEHFPFEKTKKELRFPKKVWVAARASNDGSVLGLNVIGGLLDETNFMPKASKNQDPRFNLKDRAEVLYNAMQRRMKSRFERKGQLPGILFVVSSKQTHDDFTAKRIKEAQKDPTVFVRDYALWDVKPESYLSGGWFHVVVGNEQSPSRIIRDDEDVKELRTVLPEDCVFIEVPEDFRMDFENDLEGAIRDLAGVATVSISPYIQRRDKIVDAIDPTRSHPFSVEIYDPSQPGAFYWSKLVQPTYDAMLGTEGSFNRPILNPRAPRHIHIDPSLSGDATGFCMAHVSGFTEVMRRDDEGRRYPERAPEITVDLALRIIPPVGDEIILGDVRKLVYQLSQHGFMITCVSLDSWQSADAIQKLQQKGFNAIQLSVDRTMGPYDLLKTALYEDRLKLYDYKPLIQELRELEHDRSKRKVDHPLRGSKDVSDALAGCVFTLVENSSHLPMPMLRSIPKHAGDMWMQEHQQASLAHSHGSSGAPDMSQDMGMLPPFLVGSGGGDGWG